MRSSTLPLMADENSLHIAMFPWLAFGHILPFLDLSKSLAQRGHRISFISTTRNLQRLPKIPPNLAHLISLVNLPLPQIDNLPQHAEATIDTTPQQHKFLKKAFDGLEDPLNNFLQQSHPYCVIYDFAPYWLPPIAAKLGLLCVYFNIFNASMVAFYGPLDELMSEDGGGSRLIPDDFTVPPKWIPFSSNLALRFHEAPQCDGSGDSKSNLYRLGSAIQGCDFMAVRSCSEFESEWLSLDQELFSKPVVPLGLLPPPTAQDSVEEEEDRDRDGKWVSISDWLEKQKKGSVVYVALGSESNLSQDQLTELALGLELSELPFFWVLRKPLGDDPVVLPTGFEDRVKNRGVVCVDWAPQLKILAHESVGGFLTHCGWSSIVEGLAFGLALVLLPLSPPQALNARVLEWKKIGLEIARNERDGTLRSDSVSDSLRFVMVEEEGELLRSNAKEMKEIFGDTNRHDRYVDDFVRYLVKHR